MQPENHVGIVGLGLLGSALAERFLAAGFRVAGFDLDPKRRAALMDLGGDAKESLAEVARFGRRLVLSLPNSDVVAAVLDEIADDLSPQTIVVDTTTGDPQQMANFGARLAERQITYLDATVAGSSRQARAGDVVVMVGGEQHAYSTCADLFASFARETFHVGPCGSGARMKLVVNLVLGLNRAVLAEGLAFAEASGLDGTTALEILKAGPAYSRAMDAKGDKMLARDFAPEARLSQHLKDVRLILDAGRQCDVHLPLSELHVQLLEQLESKGFGQEDNSAIIRSFLGMWNT